MYFHGFAGSTYIEYPKNKFADFVVNIKVVSPLKRRDNLFVAFQSEICLLKLTALRNNLIVGTASLR